MQPFEIDIIQTLLVIVVLTHCDVTSRRKREELCDYLRSQICVPVPCVEVASVEEELECITTRKFGAERLIERVYVSVWDSLAERLPSPPNLGLGQSGAVINIGVVRSAIDQIASDNFSSLLSTLA